MTGDSLDFQPLSHPDVLPDLPPLCACSSLSRSLPGSLSRNQQTRGFPFLTADIPEPLTDVLLRICVRQPTLGTPTHYRSYRQALRSRSALMFSFLCFPSLHFLPNYSAILAGDGCSPSAYAMWMRWPLGSSVLVATCREVPSYGTTESGNTCL